MYTLGIEAPNPVSNFRGEALAALPSYLIAQETSQPTLASCILLQEPNAVYQGVFERRKSVADDNRMGKEI